MSPVPFRIDVPDAVLGRISAKLHDARIGYAPEDDGGWKYGTDARYLAELVEYWRDRYDWRRAEAGLNRFPQFKAKIEGIDVHFYHVKADGSKAVPILLTHGWPGSVVEFQEVIPLLVASGFDVVVPSLPGFGWSQRPPTPVGMRTVARMWRTLMVDVLGYRRFGAQGGDWGAPVTCWLGTEHIDAVAGVHLNFFMPPPPAATDDEEANAYWRSVRSMQARESAYQYEHSTKPQTIGLALHDNPVGWAAWVIEKFHGWGDTHGEIESSFSKDRLITNLMSYLVNDAVLSSIWAYRGMLQDRFTGPVVAPTALAKFPGEFYPMPSRRLAERAYNLKRWTEMPSGGHFAAMEKPVEFAADVAAFFKDIK